MPEECRNIYKKARRAAGVTQEAAAERLGISVESVRAYETGQRIPPNEVVEDMADCYDYQRLAYQHLKATNALAARIIPAIEERSLMELALRIYNRLRRFAQEGNVDKLLTIAEDGHIDQEERAEFDAILADLREIVKSGLELEVFCREGSKGERKENRLQH